MQINKEKINSIQFLRGIGAIMVAFCHTALPDWGTSGVDIFLVLSGFVLMYSTEQSADNFWIKRIIKIVPLYWLMTLITGACVIIAPQLFKSYEVNVEYLLKSLFFIPYKHSGIRQPVLGLGWTLNIEMFFYLIFWFAIKINHAKRGIYAIIMSVILVTIRFLHKIPLPFSTWMNNILLEFCYGIILYYVYKYFQNKYKELRNKKMFSVIFYLVLIIGLFCMDGLRTTDIPRGLGPGLVSMIIVAWVLFLGNFVNLPKSIIYVGNISYVLYLTHMYPIRMVETLMPASGILKIPVSILGILVAIICAGIWNRHVEQRVQDFLRHKFIKK